MIPIFPQFRSLRLTDRSSIQRAAAAYPPYSDWNFVSLWTWSFGKHCALAQLNGNLVIIFNDYVTQQPYLSYLGQSSPVQTIRALLSYASRHSIEPALRYIPAECVYRARKKAPILCTRDRANYDYIFSIPTLITLGGNRFRSKRNFINRFVRKYINSYTITTLDLQSRTAWKHVNGLLERWTDIHSGTRAQTAYEIEALQTLKHDAHFLGPLHTTALFVKSTLVAISIDEILHKGYAHNHHELADTRYVGSYQYIRQCAAVSLHNAGATLLNFEQDMGKKNLRKAKRSWKPVQYLRKYTIRLKDS